MHIVAAVGGACFLLVCIVGGGRLLLLSRRTRKFPEFALGAGMLLMGGIGTPLTAAARAPLGLSDDAKMAVLGAQALIMALGTAGFARFTQVVFRPNAVWAKLLMIALPLGMLAGDLEVALQERGFLLVLEGYLGGYLVQQLLMLATLVWTGVESLAYSGVLKRRLALGLVDPVVADRVQLWGIGMLLASLMIAATIGGQLLAFDIMATIAGAAGIACTGVVAGGAIYLAFLPPPFYLRWVIARSPSGA